LFIRWDHAVTETKPVEGFNVYRRLSTGTDYVKLTTVGATVKEAEDTTVVPGLTYCYRIGAFNVAGESMGEDSCSMAAGVYVYLKPNQTLSISRRSTNGSTVVAILANKSEVIEQNKYPEDGKLTLNLKSALNLTQSRRSTDGSSIVSILINKDEYLMVNGQFVPF
jgi:hypothetical protein